MRFRPPFAAAFAVLLALFAAAVTLRMHAVEKNIGLAINCPDCFDAAVLRADLQVLAVLCGLLLLAGWLRRRPVTVVVHFVVGLALLVLAADALVHWLFRYRLFIADAWTYVAEYRAVWDQLSGGVGGAGLAALVLLAAAGAVGLLIVARPAQGVFERVVLAVVAVTSLGASAVIARPAYVNNWAIANTFVLNFDRPDAVPYSEQAARALLDGKRPAREVAGGPRGRRNVVLVIVESWSSWHSEAFGGYQNWTPQLDAAAQRGVILDDFHAVAYSTERGLVGLLAGQDLWAPFHSWLKGELFYGLWGLRPSLASVFTDAGYHAAFLTTGPLSLYRKGEWLRSLGFDETEGGD
ncbi:MAG: sulfatase-like hydrolase/transferase, partial [Xanthomonadales bacterium]|nr:sulfatase-like hydrolase/transferase [Xanthomonadales bacterium]